MKRISVGLLIVLALLVVGSGVYLQRLKKPKGRVLSSIDSNNRTVIDTNLIAFVSDRDGNDEIYITNNLGTLVKRITNTPEKEYGPVFSNTTNQLAFFVQDEGFNTIWLYSLNSNEKRLLTFTRETPKSIEFSPDGRWLTLYENSSILKENNNLFIINAQNGKTERVATNVEGFHWTDDSKTIVYEHKSSNSITQSKIEIRSIEEGKLTVATELFEGGVAPVFLSSSRRVLFLDATSEFLRLVSMNLRGEKQEEIFKIKIRPQENTKYIMNLSPSENQIILQILSDQVLLESLIISLAEKSVKTIDLETNKFKWIDDQNIVYTGKDQSGNLQLWTRKLTEPDAKQITEGTNNWL